MSNDNENDESSQTMHQVYTEYLIQFTALKDPSPVSCSNSLCLAFDFPFALDWKVFQMIVSLRYLWFGMCPRGFLSEVFVLILPFGVFFLRLCERSLCVVFGRMLSEVVVVMMMVILF
jgi:hypothetical protein